MRRRIVIAAAVALAVGLVLGLAASAMAGDTGSSSQKPARTITVTSTATVRVPPDEAVVTFGVETESSDSATALSTNAQDMQAVIDALQAAGIDRADIQTLAVTLSQKTLNPGKPNEQRVFVASNRIQVTVHDLSKIGSVIDAAVGAGATSVANVQFQLSDPNQVRADALASAVRGARAKADALAEAAGAHVVRVVTIQEDTYRQPVYAANAAAGMGGALAPTPVVPPKTLEASETVTVVWEID